MSNRTRWMIQAVSGLVGIGLGASVSIEAGVQKALGDDWFTMGTLGLIALCAGVSLAADSVRFRIRADQERERRG